MVFYFLKLYIYYIIFFAFFIRYSSFIIFQLSIFQSLYSTFLVYPTLYIPSLIFLIPHFILHTLHSPLHTLTPHSTIHILHLTLHTLLHPSHRHSHSYTLHHHSALAKLLYHYNNLFRINRNLHHNQYPKNIQLFYNVIYPKINLPKLKFQFFPNIIIYYR